MKSWEYIDIIKERLGKRGGGFERVRIDKYDVHFLRDKEGWKYLQGGYKYMHRSFIYLYVNEKNREMFLDEVQHICTAFKCHVTAKMTYFCNSKTP